MDLTNFAYPLVGGILIGLASVVMLYFNGRIAGISGLLGMSLDKLSSANAWRYLFLFGLVLGSIILNFINPGFYNYQIPVGYPTAIAAGLFVGFGTRLGKGCTSGHGVCGLSRVSFRSLVATVTFIGLGMLTVAVVKQF